MSRGKDERFQNIPISSIDANEGQIEGLPANPRLINEQKFKMLKDNITAYPELLDYRGLLVYPYKGRYVTIGGNMRLRALNELGHREAPCVVLSPETSIEQLKAYIILDNDNFGQWDWDLLANEWDTTILSSFGLDIIGMQGDIDDLFVEPEGGEKKTEEEKITIIIPEDMVEQKEQIMDNIKSILAPFNGVKIR